MFPGLGWSASDIVLAVKVITKVCIAFRDAGGAQEQYASTTAFLDAFARTLQRINAYTETVTLGTDGKELSADLTSQMKLIYVEYVKFDTYLKKIEPGLSSASFASRIVARAKWAIKEINAKVETLKKSVITPMMFVTPLLAVETLTELRDIKSRLPNAALQEDALRENRVMIVKMNDDLAHLRDNLESYWWTRRWAMSAVEDDIKSLTLAVKNNSDILSNQVDEIQSAVAQESAKARQEQAAANLTTISTVETIMESRLAYVESRIDILIAEYRSKTGKDDQELHMMKKRIATSRQHLHTAASSARKALKHFGLLVMAVNHMHSNPFTKFILPLAGHIVGYDKIFEHGEKMVKNAGETVTSSGRYIQESDVMKNLKSWNPFTAAISNEKARLGDRPTPAAGAGKPQSPPASPPPATFTSTRSPVLNYPPLKPTATSASRNSVSVLDDDFGDFESVSTSTRPHAQSRINTSLSNLSGPTLAATQSRTTTVDLLLDEPIAKVELFKSMSSISAAKATQPQVSILAINYAEDNPWA